MVGAKGQLLHGVSLACTATTIASACSASREPGRRPRGHSHAPPTRQRCARVATALRGGGTRAALRRRWRPCAAARATRVRPRCNR